MAYTTIDKPTDYFNTNIWTGNGSSQSISGLDFAPDWVWIKQRSGTRFHNLQDTIRGTGLQLFSNSTSADNTDSTNITAFNSDGYSLGAGQNVNNSSSTYVGWSWLAGGTASSNTDGSITSSVSANTTAGFSIVSFTGTGSNATVGHGLSAVPKMIITKKRSSADNWYTYHASLGATKVVYLDLTTASETYSTNWNDTEPTSSVFSLGTAGTNSSGSTYIAYCFAEKKGYSKFGSYTGNGNSDGTFVYTGFKPAMVIGKASSRADVWWMHDNKRDTINPMNRRIMPNSSSAEGVEWEIDYLSNGFKIRTTDAQANGSGETYIYMAFAESPFVSSTKIPTTAR